MPSVVSHPAAALGLSRWFGLSRAAIVTGAVLSVLPDADAIGFWLGVPYGSLFGHRGLTHSLAYAALLAVAAFGLLRLADRGARALVLLPYLFLCAASHGLLDGMTNGGLGVAWFAPFSERRFFLPWRPIPVSPISVTGFFSERGLAILAGEFLLIWIPCALLALAGMAVRRRRPVSRQ